VRAEHGSTEVRRIANLAMPIAGFLSGADGVEARSDEL
jgi:hypothetical protein